MAARASLLSKPKLLAAAAAAVLVYALALSVRAERLAARLLPEVGHFPELVSGRQKHAILKDSAEEETWSYTCWEGQHTSRDAVTVVSVVSGLPQAYHTFLRSNRLAYAARHGYTYCELGTLDATRIPPWSKLPWILSLLPCTDYLVHIDADAVVVNHTRPLTPWLHYMRDNGLDLLLAADIVVDSPLNFGVFMVRPGAGFVWRLFKALYNRCACDWSRLHDWPAEQSLIYDLLAEDGGSAAHAAIIELDHWNSILLHGTFEIDPRDVVAHVPNSAARPNSTACKDASGASKRECKYDGILYFYEQISERYSLPSADSLLEGVVLRNTTNSCQSVTFTRYVSKDVTYSTVMDRWESSVMHFASDEAGQISGVVVGEIACAGWARDERCSVRKRWNTTAGTGPIMPRQSGIELE